MVAYGSENRPHIALFELLAVLHRVTLVMLFASHYVLSMEIIRTAVAEIGYLESGPNDGFPVFFLHGFPDDAHTWDGVVAKLEGLPLRMLRPFLRGFGPSRVTVSEAKSGQFAALAQDVIDLADAPGIQ